MLKLFSSQTIILILSGVVLSTSAAISWAFALGGAADQGVLGHLRMVGFVVFALFLGLTHSTVWRWFWSLPYCREILASKIVPDLTGFWRFTVLSNFPIIDALNQTNEPTETRPDLSEHVFIGFFRQGWLKSDFEVFGHDGSILDTSDTLLLEFSREANSRKPKIYWFYEQTNQRFEEGDTVKFQGASELKIQNPSRITGLTWSNRNWESGRNTAGPIHLEKLASAPLRGMSDEALSNRVLELYEAMDGADH